MPTIPFTTSSEHNQVALRSKSELVIVNAQDLADLQASSMSLPAYDIASLDLERSDFQERLELEFASKQSVEIISHARIHRIVVNACKHISHFRIAIDHDYLPIFRTRQHDHRYLLDRWSSSSASSQRCRTPSFQASMILRFCSPGLPRWHLPRGARTGSL